MLELNGFYQSCYSRFSTPLTVYRASTTIHFDKVRGSTVTALHLDSETAVNTTVISSGTKYVDAVLIYWRPSELSLFDPTYASQLASRLHIKYDTAVVPTTLPSQIATPGATSSLPRSTSPPSPSALRRGAITGIGLGASLGLITLAAASFLLYKWRKRRTAHKDQEEQAGDDIVPGMAELQDPRQQASELEVKEKVGKLSSPVAELDGEATCKGREEVRVEGALP
jgi:hypothetical protein